MQLAVAVALDHNLPQRPGHLDRRRKPQRRCHAQHGGQQVPVSQYPNSAIKVFKAMNRVTRGADALVLCGAGQCPQLRQFLVQRDFRCVHAMIFPPPPRLTCVGFDNARAIGQAVHYPLDLGHRRIAMLAGVARHNDRASARIDGVRLALVKAGQALAPHHMVE